MLRLLFVGLLTIPALAFPIPKGAAPGRGSEVNSNTLLKAYAGKMTFDASSEWGGWPITNLFDGDNKTAWYSASGDAPMAGKNPWVRATFPENVMVSRVTVLGNRDPQHPTGYFALAGTLDFLDGEGNTILKVDLKSSGEKHDFDHEPRYSVRGVRAVRFTATQDEQSYNCIGLSELLVE